MGITYKIPLAADKTIASLTSEELVAARNAFSHWVDHQPVHVGNADKPFLNAFKVLIQYRQGNVNFLPQQAKEAEALLEKGFFFSNAPHSETRKVARGKGYDGAPHHGKGHRGGY